MTAELRPGQAGNAALTTATVSVQGQFLLTPPGETLPDIKGEIGVVPPLATCPHCGAELPDGARECRRCGERIRLCLVCGTPNTWLARLCRRSAAHVLRTEVDWRMSPGGDATHGVAPTLPLGGRLARRWSSPPFPVGRVEDVAEWSAPLAAFGMGIASAIEPDGAGRRCRRLNWRRARHCGSTICRTRRASTRTVAAWRCRRTGSCTRRHWAGPSSPWTPSGGRAVGSRSTGHSLWRRHGGRRRLLVPAGEAVCVWIA